jgi:hypothetical protein
MDSRGLGVSMVRLNRCPFCGEEEDITIRFKTYDGSCDEIAGYTYCYVECLPCDARSGNCWESDAVQFGFNSAKHMAFFSWNKRVTK